MSREQRSTTAKYRVGDVVAWHSLHIPEFRIVAVLANGKYRINDKWAPPVSAESLNLLRPVQIGDRLVGKALDGKLVGPEVDATESFLDVGTASSWVHANGTPIEPPRTSGASDHSVANAGLLGSPRASADVGPGHLMQNTTPARGPEEAGIFQMLQGAGSDPLGAAQREAASLRRRVDEEMKRADTAERRANDLSDECGSLRTQVGILERTVGQMAMKVEMLEKRRV